MAQFKDPETGEITEYVTFTTSFTKSGKVYKDKNNKQIVNSNNIPLEFIEKVRQPGEEFVMPSFLQFDNSSGQNKQKILQKRSSVDYKKNLEEKRLVQQKDAVSQLQNIVTKKE